MTQLTVKETLNKLATEYEYHKTIAQTIEKLRTSIANAQMDGVSVLVTDDNIERLTVWAESMDLDIKLRVIDRSKLDSNTIVLNSDKTIAIISFK